MFIVISLSSHSRDLSLLSISEGTSFPFLKYRLGLSLLDAMIMENFVCFCDTRSMAPDKRNHQRTPQNYKGEKVVILILPALMPDFLSVLSQLIVLLDDLII